MLPKTRRSPHNSPWSSSDDAWSGRKSDSVNDTIILGDDHSAAKPKPRGGPLRHLASALEGLGFSVWFDHKLLGGANFYEEIERQMALPISVSLYGRQIRSRPDG